MMKAKDWVHQTGDSYLIVGRTRDGRRFRMTSTNPHHVNGINLWDGRVYQVRDNRRILVKRVQNG